MRTKLKLDLHTHVFEEFLPISPNLITLNSVRRIVEKIKSAGLDGIAITEHDNREYGYRVKAMIEQHFKGQTLIIPGREIEEFEIHYVELDLDADGKKTFRFLAHPGYPGNLAGPFDRFRGIEIENAMHNWHIDKKRVRELADKHHLIVMSNSDAHYLRDIGKNYTEITLEDLGF